MPGATDQNRKVTERAKWGRYEVWTQPYLLLRVSFLYPYKFPRRERKHTHTHTERERERERERGADTC